MLRTRNGLSALLLIAPFLFQGRVIAQEDHLHTNREDARVLPLPTGDDVFHFVVYGDRTGGPAEGIEVLKQAVQDTNLLDPDLVMTVGDLIQGYNTESPWLAQMNEYQRVMGDLDMPWFPVAGNHDVYWRGPESPLHQHEVNYEKHFGPLWYWFEHKGCGFFVLYSDEGDRETGRKGWGNAGVNQFSSEQLEWLQGELQKTSELQHVFVFLHHPKWRTNYYSGTNWEESVHPLLVEAGNVRGVFAGHIHQMTYRGPRDGIEYYTLATVGGHLRADIPSLGLMHHLNVVTVRDEGFEVATIPVGGVVDPQTFTDDFLEDSNLAANFEVDLKSDPLTFQDDGSASNQLLLDITNPSSQSIEATVSLEAPGAGFWFFTPDHLHRRVPPGQTTRFRLRMLRAAQSFDALIVPKVEIQVDYLRDGLRLELPSRSIEIPVDLTSLPTGDGEAEDQALSFDGQSYVHIDPKMLSDLPDGPLTLEAWMRGEHFNGRIGLVAKTESSEFGIFVSDKIAQFSMHAGGAYGTARDPDARLREDRWHHVAGVFDGEEVRVYVDGRLAGGEARSGRRRRNDLPLILGGDVNRNGGTSLFTGHLDEIRLSTVARYRGEVFVPERRFAADEHTWLLLHCDRQVGPFQPDASGHGRHGRAVGNVELESIE
ncbi:MAG: LamG-like jellyroll fold domain-containing protein [Planctomycetota bacterium]